MFHFYTPFHSIVSQYVLVQLCACRNVVIYHQQVQLLFCRSPLHTAENIIPLDSMPIMALGGRLVMAMRVLPTSSSRLIVCMNAGKDGTVGAGSVVQGEL